MALEADFDAWRPRLAALWKDSIPLAGAMQVEIRRLDALLLQLAAPLAPNRNHMGSAFGGSLQGLATLAGWGVTLVASGEIEQYRVVVRDARMRFDTPVFSELVAEAEMPSTAAVTAFRGALASRGRARLTVPVEIRGASDVPAARFVGEFVALASSGG